jgi:hypothetical protein
MKSIKLIFFILVLSEMIVCAQHEEQIYVPDPNPLIQKRIDQWQDIKFGLLMHWGPYSQWGIVESPRAHSPWLAAGLASIKKKIPIWGSKIPRSLLRGSSILVNLPRG